MLNYIATEKTANVIQKICKNQNILILYKTEDITNISKYLKETKINFNLVKYFIIEINCLNNSEDEIIESIYNFSRLYIKTRIIILAQNYNTQSNLLNKLYDIGIYNIINSSNELDVEEQLIKTLSQEGIQKKEAERFKKIEEVKIKESKIKKLIDKIKTNRPKENKKVKKKSKASDMPSNSVYLFSLLLEAVTRLVRFICYVLVFILTSIGLTILLNGELRELVFQIFGLK